MADYLNAKYGEGTVEAAVKDSYYNMIEVLADHMDVVERAREALRKAGATFEEDAGPAENKTAITKADLVLLGLSGGQDSAAKRQALLKKLDLPEHLTANGLLEALNLLYSPEELSELVKKDLY